MSQSSESTPIRILLGCDTFAPDVNGAARFAERLAAGLVRRGHDVHVAAPSKKHKTVGAFRETIEGEQMTVHRIASFRWYPHDWLRFVLPWRARHYVKQILDQVKPDVIHIQSHIVIGRALAHEGAKRGIRIVATNHVMPENVLDFTLLPERAKRLFVRWGWRDADRVLRRAKAITTPTRRAADFLERNTYRRGVLPVSCGLRASDYTAIVGPRERHKLVFVGRVTLEKEIDVIIRALDRLDPKLEATLTIVGDGDQRKNLEKLVAELGLTSRVHFTGRVSDEELRGHLTDASVFVIASIAELQSIATMEAMASGLPIVAADAMALPHLVHHGENGYLFQAGNDRELADALTKVLTADAAEYERMQQESLTAVQSHDIDRTLDTFESLYRGTPVA
ncbi:glycosyltransferase involved in cell wall biosynthesis [Mycolicibacterium mucogenicum 261Sha1.1M5]|uniref:glycosyltransferase n=1 Tax=Leucobacter aridicollis TaxID=283878 RepID=UPI000EAE450B|nr:glycosyltransferase [Leucobacter aridicollis]MCS3428805.1 glycosyltransferase involved in cell wall biosynthesis [Leucobacter aridicollis]RKQ89972.1 glycosyltransferase involved in cell wall biosynthesis [Mycolicibacterium mucogenicum 261Sha1.1M5]